MSSVNLSTISILCVKGAWVSTVSSGGKLKSLVSELDDTVRHSMNQMITGVGAEDGEVSRRVGASKKLGHHGVNSLHACVT